MTPEQVVAILGAVAALLGALGALWRQLRATHRLVNSRMDELLALAKTSSRAEGAEGERARHEGVGHAAEHLRLD